MANRTILVDNNTWSVCVLRFHAWACKMIRGHLYLRNNTHISRVGQAMSRPENRAYEIMEELDVDYVLVIFGGLTGYSSDDINKFLWMVRIGGSVQFGIFIDSGDDRSSLMVKSSVTPLFLYEYRSTDRGADIKESDYYTNSGEFRVDKEGSPTLLNCLMYKLCYYRFGDVYTEANKPPGMSFSRAFV